MNIYARFSAQTLLFMGALVMTACTGMLEPGAAGPRGTGPRGSRPDGSTGCPPAPGTNSLTDRVRLGLEPTCRGCHLMGNSGFFASLNAFESLLVRNPRLVRPGNPDESELVMLLVGQRSGSSMRQMPLSGDPFAVMSDRGETGITMEEIKNWISGLEVPSVSTEPDPSISTVQRIGAAHVEIGLRRVLGLTVDDFFRTSVIGDVPYLVDLSRDYYAVQSADRLPREFYPGTSRFMPLGGNTAIFQQHEDRSISTAFIQNMIPLSQAWCGLAVNKPGNTRLFTVATPTTGTGDMAALRNQVRDWYLIFLAKVADDEDIDFVVDDVFAPHEAASNATRAWIGTCSYFIRHPLFVFY